MFDIYKIILLDKSYVSKLADLESKCFSKPWTHNMFLGDLSSEYTCYFGAFDSDTLVGYAGMWMTVDEGQITNVAVHPDYRRKGIAQKLVNKLMEICKENKLVSITLEVRESNYNAIKLYDKMGFSRVGLRKNYYKNPTENALLMTERIE